MHVRSDERGLTLPEVMIAITILAIIVAPLTEALIGFVRNTDATTRRMNQSHDIQLASAYFGRDIQKLGVHDWSSPTLALLQSVNNPNYPCTGPGTTILSLAWDDPTTVSGAPTVIRVTYLVRDVGAEHQLRRLLCRGSGTVESDLVVAHNLVGTPGPPVCQPSPCTGAGSAVPQRVTLTVTIGDPAYPDPGPATVTLTGQRGQS
jgi:prepilin-type N-terminal cleavage/methylation domain-containing protein